MPGPDELILAQILRGEQPSRSPFDQPMFQNWADVPVAGGGVGGAAGVLRQLLGRGGSQLGPLLSRLMKTEAIQTNPLGKGLTVAQRAKRTGRLGLGLTGVSAAAQAQAERDPGSILNRVYGDVEPSPVGGPGGAPGGGSPLISKLQEELTTIEKAIAEGGPQYSVENFQRMRSRQQELLGLLGGLGYTPGEGDDEPTTPTVTPTIGLDSPDALQRLFDQAIKMGDYAGALRIYQEFQEGGAGGGLDPTRMVELQSAEQAQQGALMQQGNELMASLLPYLIDPGQQNFPGFAGGGAVPQVPVQHQQMNPMLAAQWLQSARGR